MRIISGERRGMTILSPKTDGTRPITDRVKESVFNILQKYGGFEGKRAADLFSGTGSMGLEALSRGAEHVTFVESNFAVIDVLKKNIERGNWKERSKIVKANAFKVGAASIDEAGFDYIFVDPPYVLSRNAGERSELASLLERLTEQTAKTGVVIVRTEVHVDVLDQYGGLRKVDRREWGSMAVTFLKHAEIAEGGSEARQEGPDGSEGTGN